MIYAETTEKIEIWRQKYFDIHFFHGLFSDTIDGIALNYNIQLGINLFQLNIVAFSFLHQVYTTNYKEHTHHKQGWEDS